MVGSVLALCREAVGVFYLGKCDVSKIYYFWHNLVYLHDFIFLISFYDIHFWLIITEHLRNFIRYSTIDPNNVRIHVE